MPPNHKAEAHPLPVPADPAPEPPIAEVDIVEENIYEVMKDHMRQKKEETDARYAAERQARAAGRPGPSSAQAAPAPTIEKVRDVTDLPAVWNAARNYLANSARYLDSVLGHCCHVESLNADTGEAIIMVPGTQKGFANEKARLKLEEALRAVTGLGIRLALQFTEETRTPADQGPEASRSGVSAGPVSQRVPAEVIDAVKQQRVVQELMKRLDATVTSVEIITDHAE
jgi:hypothetical protein